MDHRKQAKRWFITCPQLGDLRPIDADLSLTVFLTWMEEQLPENKVVKAILSHEDHAERGDIDGGSGVHIHLAFELERKWKCPSDMEFFDGVYGKHPNIQTCRNFQRVVIYVGKDGDYETFNIDYEAMCRAVSTKTSYNFNAAANQIKEGKTLKDLWLDKESAGFVLHHKRKIEEAIDLNERIKREKVYPSFVGFPLDHDEEPARARYKRFVNQKMTSGHHKTLWVNGITHTGKSTLLLGNPNAPLLDNLTNYFKCYRWITSEDKQSSDILDSDYIVVDEFKGQIYIGELIQLLDQFEGYKVAIKGFSAVPLRKRLPVFITAQNTPEFTFHKVGQDSMDALKRRLFQVTLTVQYPFPQDEFDDQDEFGYPPLPPPPPLPPREESDEDHSEHSNEERRKRRMTVSVGPSDQDLIEEGNRIRDYFLSGQCSIVPPDSAPVVLFELDDDSSEESFDLSVHPCETSQDYNNIPSEDLLSDE